MDYEDFVVGGNAHLLLPELELKFQIVCLHDDLFFITLCWDFVFIIARVFIVDFIGNLELL